MYNIIYNKYIYIYMYIYIHNIYIYILYVYIYINIYIYTIYIYIYNVSTQITYTCGDPEAGFGMDIFAYRTWDLSKKHTTLGKSFGKSHSWSRHQPAISCNFQAPGALNDVLPAGETVMTALPTTNNCWETWGFSLDTEIFYHGNLGYHTGN
jgi:hypothetical protein